MFSLNQRTRTHAVKLVVSGLLVAGLAGCKSKTEEAPAPAAGAAAKPPAPSPFGPSVERAMSHYAEGYNTLIDLVGRPMDAYFRQVGEDVQGPPKRKPILVAIIPITKEKIETVAEAFEKGKKATPPGSDTLSGPAGQAVAAARKLLDEYDEAVVYYKAEKYKEDEGKGGIDIHKRLSADYETYKTALGAMDGELKKLEQLLMVKDFQLHGDPATYGHQFRGYNLPAMAFMGVGPDAAEAKKLYDELDAAYKKIKAFIDTKGSGVPGAFNGYMMQVDKFYAQATVVERGVREKASDKVMDRELSKLTTYYNNLIGSTNTLYKLESQGLFR